MVVHSLTSLFVGDLSLDTTEALLFEVFNPIGPVASVRVCRDLITRKSLGSGYVNFHRNEDAQQALATLNYQHVRGRPMRLMWSQRDPALRKSSLGNIFIKNLHKDIDNKALHDIFAAYGEVLSVKVVQKDKNSLGYGFVHFASEDNAASAIEKVNGKVMMGQAVEVAAFKPRGSRKTVEEIFTNVFVKELPAEIKKTEDLKQLFSEFGTVTSCQLAEEGGAPKGFGFANFQTHAMAEKAINGLNGKRVDGKTLIVCRAQAKDERERRLRDERSRARAERQEKMQGLNLYIKNLHSDIDNDRLRALFEPFGKVVSCRVMVDGQGSSRGFGFVCFDNDKSVREATEQMNGKLVEKRPLYVSLAQSKEDRSRELQAEFSARGRVLTMPAAAQMMFGQPPFVQSHFPQPMEKVPWGTMPGPAPMYGGTQMGGEPIEVPAVSNKLQWRPSLKQEHGLTLTRRDLESLSKPQQTQLFGQHLYPQVERLQPNLAGKVTGMLLELPTPRLLRLVNNPDDLSLKVQEAVKVLQAHQHQGSPPSQTSTLLDYAQIPSSA